MSYLKFYAGKSDGRCGRSPAGMNATGESDLKNYYDYVDTLRESKLRPALEQLLPVIAMSAWGSVPENLDISFPPLWTPTASETAQIAERKALAIRDIFQAGLIQADTALRELKGLSEETGMFGNISDEEIAGAQGKTYQDVTALRDPLDVRDYDRQERAFRGGAKTEAGTDRIVTVSPKIQPIIDRLTADKIGGPVFCAEDGGALRIEKYREMFYQLLADCGIDNPEYKVGNVTRKTYTPHSCRHTFATLMKRVGGADKDKLELMGYTSTEMLRHYQDVNLADLRAITNAI